MLKLLNTGVGTSHKSTSGPQQHLNWSNSGPF